MKAYLGVDIGSISTKAAVINTPGDLLASEYLWTEGDPIGATRRVMRSIEQQVRGKGIEIEGTATTGSAQRLVGRVLDATLVKNEITCHAVGTLHCRPDVQTIFEIGGQDSKMIILRDGIVVDYAMNTLCAAGTGAFLSAQARRMGIPVEDFGPMALRAQHPARIAGRCTVFAESDMVHKAQMGHRKEDLVAGLCRAVVHNYLNNVGKGKDIRPPIVFQGGVSKNVGVVKAFEEITGQAVLLDERGHLMGAYGAAVLACHHSEHRPFTFDLQDIEYETRGFDCEHCPNQCEVLCVLRDGEFLDAWGHRCSTGFDQACQACRSTPRSPAVQHPDKELVPV